MKNFNFTFSLLTRQNKKKRGARLVSGEASPRAPLGVDPEEQVGCGADIVLPRK